MIRGFKHKGLARLYERNERRGLSADMVPKIERVVARLDIAKGPEYMNVPGWGLHPLKGKMKGLWSIWVTGNWRIVFRFRGNDVIDVDLVDYH